MQFHIDSLLLQISIWPPQICCHHGASRGGAGRE